MLRELEAHGGGIGRILFAFFYIFIFVAIHDLTYDTIELTIYYLSICFLFSCGYLVQRWTGQHRYNYLGTLGVRPRVLLEMASTAYASPIEKRGREQGREGGKRHLPLMASWRSLLFPSFFFFHSCVKPEDFVVVIS